MIIEGHSKNYSESKMIIPLQEFIFENGSEVTADELVELSTGEFIQYIESGSSMICHNSKDGKDYWSTTDDIDISYQFASKKLFDALAHLIKDSV